MKIPTYRQETARPRQGSGQMLNVQLSEAAMTATAQQTIQSGRQLAQTASQFSDFAYKKILAASETEAAQANADYQMDLQNLEEELLLKKDMVKAESEFTRRSRQLQSKYNKGLSNTLGRKSFGSLAASSQTKQALKFSRLANAKIIDQATAATNNTVFNHKRNAADLGSQPIQRMYEIAELRRTLENAAPVIGADKAAEKMRQSFADITSGILNNQMDAAVAAGKNPHDVVEDWMAGRNTDAVLAELDTAVSDKDKAKIKEKLLQNADRIDRRAARDEKRKADAIKADTAQTKQIIFSVDRTDPASVVQAELAHQKMVRLNLYDSRSERKNAELMLGLGDAPDRLISEDGQGDPNVYTRLKTLAAADALSLTELNQNAVSLDAGQFKELSAEADRDRAEALSAAESTMRKRFQFFKENIIDDPGLRRLSASAYTAVSNDLGKWKRQNRSAGPKEVEQETERLIAQYEPAYKARKMDIAFENIDAVYSNLRTTRSGSPLGVEQPTRTNLDQVLEQIRQQIIANPGRESKALRERLFQLQGSILMARGGQ